MSNIRETVWERKFPGSSEIIKDIFGTYPTAIAVAGWKSSWARNNTIHLEFVHGGIRKRDILEACNNVGIHPYFYDVSTQLLKNKYDELSFVTHLSYYVINFYHEEDLIMFKLAWQEI